MVNTPVLYITFARPEYASRSFAAIKNAQPKKLYFYSNKARDEKPDEIKRNLEVRSYVEQIDWDCEVKTWFRDEYVDIFTSINGAINWIFDNEEMAIVLEEDCVASLAFFDYCEKLLIRYKDEPRVRLISGDNFTPEFNPQGFDYFFTRISHIYGWASWQNRWKSLDWEMEEWPSIRKTKFKLFYPHFLERLYYSFMFSRIYKRDAEQKAWDFTTCYNMVKNDEVSVMPKHNLVFDIGEVGDNHAVSTKKEIKNAYNKSTYPTEHYPLKLSSIDSYDYPHFKKHVLGKFLQYEFKKYRKKNI